jgi:hypothetical protein
VKRGGALRDPGCKLSMHCKKGKDVHRYIERLASLLRIHHLLSALPRESVAR